MSTFTVIAGREIHIALRNRGIIITGLIFAVWFPALSAAGMVAASGEGAVAVSGVVVAITLPVAILMGYIFCSDAFLREKRDGSIETLLCAPVSLRHLWAGKTAGVAIPAYLTTLLSAVLTFATASAMLEAPPSLDLLLIPHMLVVVPVWILTAAGFIGAAQLALGMRENQILGFLFIFGFIFLISGLQGIISGGAEISAAAEAALAAAGVALLGLARFIAGRVSKERIVTTIP